MIPSIAPDQTRQCSLCGVYQSVIPGHEEHHFIPRSIGGTETITLCVRCHNATEGSTPWRVGVTDDYVFALDHRGTILVKRWFPPQDFDEGLVVAELQQSPRRLSQLSQYFRYLGDEALAAAAEALYSLGETAWHCRARLFQVAALRTPYGDKNAKLTDLARQFDISHAQARREIQALTAVEEVVQNLDSLPSPDVILEAVKSGDLQAALDLYQDRKTAGSYTLAQFRAELKGGPTDGMSAPPEYHKCPECGQPHVRAVNATSEKE